MYDVRDLIPRVDRLEDKTRPLREVRIKLAPGARMPTRGTSGAAGLDLYALLSDRMLIVPSGTVLIDTGVHIELPPGFEAQVRPRSSMSKRGLVVPVGTIDADYRGPIGVIVCNASSALHTIEPDDRIAQFVIARVEMPTLVAVDELSETARGAGGFGSTGR